MEESTTSKRISIIQHLAACRQQLGVADRRIAGHIELAYDEAVESLLILRAPQSAAH